MKVKRTKPISIEELWDYEDAHPVVFAAPRALAEARLRAELDRIKRGLLHKHGNSWIHSSSRNVAYRWLD